VRIGNTCEYRLVRSESSPAAIPVAQQAVAQQQNEVEDQIVVEQQSEGEHQNVQKSSPASGTVSMAASPYALTYQSLGQANMLHLELLHHVSTVTCQEFQRGDVDVREASDAIIKLAISSSFLMHEVLAIGALHLSILRPDQKDFYSYHAAELQSYALSIFNSQPPNHSVEHPEVVFLFSSFLGIHVLFDTLLFRPEDFSQFIERFVGYLRIHRGVYTIAQGTWTALQGTELGPLLNIGGEETVGNECDALQALMETADLSPTSVR
jgi:hypothetical protein